MNILHLSFTLSSVGFISACSQVLPLTCTADLERQRFPKQHRQYSCHLLRTARISIIYTTSGVLITVSSASLTTILVSRFLMDLQEANSAMTHQHSQISSMSSLNFGRVIGSLGSLLPAPGEISEVQSITQGNDGEGEMERVDNGVAVPDSAA